MNLIKKKLRSRAGASLILAMVFMLFCSFVGGTVLASATANAQRVAQVAEQQDFLLERSAALLASDQLQLDDGKYITLTVTDQKREIQGVKVNENGSTTPEGDLIKDRVVTFTVNTNTTLNKMHQLVLETTVWRYLREQVQDESQTFTVHLAGFGTAAEIKDFLYKLPDADATIVTNASGAYTNKVTVKNTAADKISGTLSYSASAWNGVNPAVDIPDFTANFSVGRAEDIFDFFVDFGEDSQVRMTMNAYSGTRSPIVLNTLVHEPYGAGTTPKDAEIKSTTTTTTISWQDPIIEKGGSK